MSGKDRIVPDPENKGWTQDGTTADGTPIYQWDGGRDTGNIINGAVEGEIATWHDSAQEWTPDPTVIVNGGNVGIGANSLDTRFVVESDVQRVARFRSNGAVRAYATFADANTTTENAQGFGVVGDDVKIWSGNAERLTIDASGNATFSAETTSQTLVTTRGGTGYFLKAEYGNTGNVTTFSHNSAGSNFTINPTGGSMTVVGDFSANNVRTAGGPVIDAKGLIKTLSTLRQATMDETQDIRESLRSAIDELVEGFEQEIAAMPAPEEGQDG